MTTTLLLSNPPRRKRKRTRKGQFAKGGGRVGGGARKKRRRKTTTAKRRTTRSRRAYSNPPARRRRRSTTGGARKVRIGELLTQGAAGVSGYMLTDYGTEFVLARLPGDVASRIPRAAYPAVKTGVAVVMGEAVRRHGPRQLRKYGPLITLGGVISAGIDVVQMVRARQLSGYWSPEQLGESAYWQPEQLGESDPYLTGSDRMTQLGLGAPIVVMDSEDL